MRRSSKHIVDMDVPTTAVPDVETGVHLSHDHNQPFRLLDLPIELVLKILTYAVATPGPTCLHPFSPINSAAEKRVCAQYTEPAQRTITEPPITQVNRLLRSEALPLFYRINDFHGMNWSEPRPGEWLKRIPGALRREMRGLWISSSWSGEDLGSYFKGIGLGAGVRAEMVEGTEGRGRLCSEAKGRLFRVRFPAAVMTG